MGSYILNFSEQVCEVLASEFPFKGPRGGALRIVDETLLLRDLPAQLGDFVLNTRVCTASVLRRRSRSASASRSCRVCNSPLGDASHSRWRRKRVILLGSHRRSQCTEGLQAETAVRRPPGARPLRFADRLVFDAVGRHQKHQRLAAGDGVGNLPVPIFSGPQLATVEPHAIRRLSGLDRLTELKNRFETSCPGVAYEVMTVHFLALSGQAR